MAEQNNTASLEGKTALVTGGARRIGAEIARGLHEAGMNVVVHYRRSSDEADRLISALNRKRRDSAVGAQADLLELAGLESVVKAATQWGSLDLLVNNASAFRPTPVGTVAEGDWDELIGANLKAPFFLAQAARDALAHAGGSIVNITDIYARRPLADHPVYSIAKAGLAAMTRSLAVDLAPDIRVNAVAPGAVLWPEDEAFDEVSRQRILASTTLKRKGGPEDIARAVLYLTRDAGYVTGQTIEVEGGRSLTW